LSPIINLDFIIKKVARLERTIDDKKYYPVRVGLIDTIFWDGILSSRQLIFHVSGSNLQIIKNGAD
jgi:hypothetical protein